MTLGGDVLLSTDALLGTGGWVVPLDVAVADGELRWTAGIMSARTTTEAGSDLVTDFAMLRHATDEEVLAFALRYGPLFPDLPDDRHHGFGCRACEVAAGALMLLSELLPHGAEPISAWRRLAADVAGSLHVAACYHRDEAVPDEVLTSFGNLEMERVGHGPGDPDIVRGRVPRTARGLVPKSALDETATYYGPAIQVVGHLVNVLLGRVHLRVLMAPDGPTMQIEPVGLLGALGLGLMVKMGNASGLALCSGCGETFVPSRRPVPGRRAWCDRCRNAKLPEREAARDYRARRSGSRR